VDDDAILTPAPFQDLTDISGGGKFSSTPRLLDVVEPDSQNASAAAAYDELVRKVPDGDDPVFRQSPGTELLPHLFQTVYANYFHIDTENLSAQLTLEFISPPVYKAV
jgi:hypothetical protein